MDEPPLQKVQLQKFLHRPAHFLTRRLDAAAHAQATALTLTHARREAPPTPFSTFEGKMSVSAVEKKNVVFAKWSSLSSIESAKLN